MNTSHWQTIKSQYVAGAGSLRQLAKQHVISVSTLMKRARREGWYAARCRNSSKVDAMLLGKSIGWSPLRLAFLLIPLVLTCFALLPTAQAVLDISNTATGYSCLTNNTTGVNNTADGYGVLHLNTTGSNNFARAGGRGSTAATRSELNANYREETLAVAKADDARLVWRVIVLAQHRFIVDASFVRSAMPL